MIKLFIIFFRMGLFTFGGGYAMVPIMERELVDRYSLIEKEDFLDYLSIAQSFPGPIAVNLSILMGYKFQGVGGALSALFGVVLPSFIVIILVCLAYAKTRSSQLISNFFSGVYPVIPALLLFSFLNLMKKIPLKIMNLFLLLSTFIGVAIFHLNPFWFIGGGVILGLCSYFSSYFSPSSK